MDTMIFGMFGLLAGYMFLVIAWYALTLIARWKVFTKAGLAGWKSLIPIYSEYCTFKISWKTSFFWIGLIAGTASGMLTSMMEGDETVSTAIVILSTALSIVITLINLIMNVKLSQRFGHGVLFGLGLMFLSPLFTLILGLGDSEYYGNPESGMPSRRVHYA